VRLRIDERLREKEFGLLDRLTRHGIQQKYPELHEQRAHVGKFYFRRPGGESWCDVILRLRSLTEMIDARARRRARAGGGAPGDRQLHALPASRTWTKRRSWRSTRWATCPTARSPPTADDRHAAWCRNS
jgi:hypothetical protein